MLAPAAPPASPSSLPARAPTQAPPPSDAVQDYRRPPPSLPPPENGLAAANFAGGTNSRPLASEAPVASGVPPPAYVEDLRDGLPPAAGDYKAAQQSAAAARTPSEKKFLLVITVFGSMFGAGFFLATLFLISRARKAQKRQRALEKAQGGLREPKKKRPFLGGTEQGSRRTDVVSGRHAGYERDRLPSVKFRRPLFSSQKRQEQPAAHGALLALSGGSRQVPETRPRPDWTGAAAAGGLFSPHSQLPREMPPPAPLPYHRPRRPSCSSAGGACWCGGPDGGGDRSSRPLFTLYETYGARPQLGRAVDPDAGEDADEDEDLEEARSRNVLLPPLPAYDPAAAAAAAAASARRCSVSSASGPAAAPSHAYSAFFRTMPPST
ncbi:MAG: hypothetical protein BJ554DRAFT_7211 [Olpidium bornovanus]|uniref:Transmembrane protein n=1 Tax=Olpidium bornovanus TaxID=278681 RepID=A0A8H8DK17_9FUNG|nr:MAG: hypothetical protein BJ554DRAFT_7211 [Olpidium bornovanus]